MYIIPCLSPYVFCTSGRSHDESGPIRPTPNPNISPLPPGSHILFTQSGKIEYIPLDGHNLKKNEAKTALHLPVHI